MAGWTIKREKGSQQWQVRFLHEGVRITVSTGETDSGEAKRKAARIYADYVAGEREVGPQRAKAPDFSPETIEAVLEALPERTPRGKPAKAREGLVFAPRDYRAALDRLARVLGWWE